MRLPNFVRLHILICLFLLSWDSVATTYTISGHVFHDINKNGNLDERETGISSVYVRLFYKSALTRWTSILSETNAKGSYSFAVELQSYETGFTYSVLEIGLSQGPQVSSGMNPVDFDYSDPYIPGGFNGTTTLRRYKRPIPLVPSRNTSFVHNFGHANFASFSPALPNALITGGTGSSYTNRSNVYSINLSTGQTTQLFDSTSYPLTQPIGGLGYHRKNNTYMGFTLDYSPDTVSPRKHNMILIENTNPLKITKLPLGENTWFYHYATHAVDISHDGFMIDYSTGSNSHKIMIDVRPTSVNFLHRVNHITKKFNLGESDTDGDWFANYSDMSINPTNGHHYCVYPNLGGILQKRGNMHEPHIDLGPIIFESGLPIPEWSYTLTFFDNTNHLFLLSMKNRLLYKMNVDTRVANVVSSVREFSEIDYTMQGASNPNVMIPTQNQAFRYGVTDQETKPLEESVLVKPNPVNARNLSVSLEAGIEVVELLTPSGHRLLTRKAAGVKNTEIIIPSNTTAGNYLIRVMGRDGKIVTKNIVVE